MNAATIVLVIIVALLVLAVSLAFVVCDRVAAQRRRERRFDAMLQAQRKHSVQDRVYENVADELARMHDRRKR